jgi:cysteine desulfurase/selenocysteine lyase
VNRADFPILKNHPDLVYLDSANTTLKPQPVIDAITDYYQNYNANIGRATYQLAEQATSAYNNARQKIAQFINAQADETIFTYSTTYAINQAAQGLKNILMPNDIILLTEYEHNSNILVWQKVAQQTKAKIAYLDDNPPLDRVKIFAYTLVSNVNGQIFDHTKLVQVLKNQGATILVDAAQAISKLPIDVAKLNCDFLVFSSHKLYGPSGVGALYTKAKLQPKLQPLIYGSQTFADISRQDVQLLSSVEKFEPGTPNVEGVIGLGAAVDYLSKIGMSKVQLHDQALITHAKKQFQKLGLSKYLVAPTQNQVGVFSFTYPRIHPHDFALFLDADQIAVRAGKVCSDILIQKLKLSRGVVRISFGLYTTKKDIDKFAESYRKITERLDG